MKMNFLRNKKWVLFLIIPVLAGLILILFEFKSSPFKKKEKLIAKVGNYEIFNTDIENKIAFEKCLNRPLDKIRALGILFHNGFLNALATPLGIDKKILKAKEDEEFNLLMKEKKNSFMSISDEALECLKKKLIKKDLDEFYKIAIEPSVLEKLIYTTFYSSEEIQAPAKEKALKILDEVKKNPDKFEEIAKKEKGIIHRKSKVILVKSSKNVNLRNRMRRNFNEVYLDSSSPIYKDVLSKLKPGQVYPELYSSLGDVYFRIIKLAKKEDNTFYLESLSIPKKNFYKWQLDYLRNHITIEIYDKEYCEGMKQLYKDDWFFNLITCK